MLPLSSPQLIASKVEDFSTSKKSSSKTLADSLREYAGTDGYDYRPMLATNEELQWSTIEALTHHPVVGDTMVACSGLFALNAFAVRALLGSKCRLRHLVIIDCSLRVEHCWEMVQSVIVSSKTRLQALNGIERGLEEHGAWYYNNEFIPLSERAKEARKDIEEQIMRLRREIHLGLSFLCKDDRFYVVKEMLSSRFRFLRLNWKDEVSMRCVEKMLRKEGHTVSDLYISNMLEYAADDGVAHDFIPSVDVFAHHETVVIDTEPRFDPLPHEDPSLAQRVRLRGGEDIGCFLLEPSIRDMASRMYPPIDGLELLSSVAMAVDDQGFPQEDVEM